MITVHTPPTKVHLCCLKNSLFLGGSIEMGAADNWQEKLIKRLEELQVVDLDILNPRREHWDSSWVQDKRNPVFREQVEWELVCQEESDLNVYYFDPNTKSPITLLELGLFSSGTPVVVCCPDGYFRKGNVDIVCERYNIDTVVSLEELAIYIRNFFLMKSW